MGRQFGYVTHKLKCRVKLRFYKNLDKKNLKNKIVNSICDCFASFMKTVLFSLCKYVINQNTIVSNQDCIYHRY